jgi:uncharacterized glyoxalase superfamily protein PhnB
VETKRRYGLLDSLACKSYSADEWFAVLSRDGFSLMLWQGVASPNQVCDAYIWVSDVNVLHDELQERGTGVANAPETMPYGLREMSLHDPHGYSLTFGQRVK